MRILLCSCVELKPAKTNFIYYATYGYNAASVSATQIYFLRSCGRGDKQNIYYTIQSTKNLKDCKTNINISLNMPELARDRHIQNPPT